MIFSSLGAEAAWQAGLLATGAVSALALVAVVMLTPPQRPVRPAGKTSWVPRFPRREFVMLMLAGSVVALFVGCFYSLLSLLPSYLHATGWSPGDAGGILAALGWAPIVFSPIGGVIAMRLRSVVPMIAICIFIWGSGVVGVAMFGVRPWLIGPMLVFGPLPIGAVMSLAALAVAPERRGIGSGVFMACLFLGTSAILPAVAWMGERAGGVDGGGEATAILFCGVAYLGSLLPLAMFEALRRRSHAALAGAG